MEIVLEACAPQPDSAMIAAAAAHAAASAAAARRGSDRPRVDAGPDANIVLALAVPFIPLTPSR
jgi:hypothetical protein